MADTDKKFLGTYFDVDAALKLSRTLAVLSWVVVAIYALDMIVGGGTMLLQYLRGFMSGLGPTDILQNVLYFLERPLHGILYFAILQAISKGILILMDMEANTRRASRR